MQITKIDYQNLIPVYKPVGKTPLECVEQYKQKHPEQSTAVISYAGRLDPMAEGVLLLLVGDTNKRRRVYEHFNKEYEVSVLVGFSTDTGDLMGKLVNNNEQSRISNEVDRLRESLPSFVGPVEQQYPAYSSAKVSGKPLYWWARQNRLHEVEIPIHTVQIDSIELISEDSITNEVLLRYIVESIRSVMGDFRQEEIIRDWTAVLHKNIDQTALPRFTLRVSCGSGTYIRQLIADIGRHINVPLCVFKISRTKVEEFTRESCELLW
ncbi:hypothetical protein KBB12_00340 [Candidatus Woesebacteria bacterium]|nr:hypothetical protein [Candidatus Woesebacteria bacterium]